MDMNLKPQPYYVLELVFYVCTACLISYIPHIMLNGGILIYSVPVIIHKLRIAQSVQGLLQPHAGASAMFRILT